VRWTAIALATAPHRFAQESDLALDAPARNARVNVEA
jgi:hypothetical protein